MQKVFMKISVLLMVTTLTFLTCTGDMENQRMESEKLQAIVEEYFDEILALYPTFATYIGDNRYDDQIENDGSLEHIEKDKELCRRYLQAAGDLNRDFLQGQDRLSYDVFLRDLTLRLESFQFPGELIPIHQMDSQPLFFIQMGSGTSIHPFKSVKDYDNFLKRMDAIQDWTSTAVENMKKGIQQGVVQPKLVMEKVVPQFQAQLTEDVEESIFYKPIAAMPEGFSEADKHRLSESYKRAIETRVIPMYRQLVNFIQDEYIPHCRTTIGLTDLPDGEAWYAWKVKYLTTTDLTPDEIHDIGLEEVERIKGEMLGVMEQVQFQGDLNAFFTFLRTDPRFYYTREEDLLGGYEIIRDRIDGTLLQLFQTLPKANYEIRQVEAYREKSEAAAHYMGPTPDGSRPGIFYVNTYDLNARPIYEMEALSLHEAAPGHHFQISIQQEQKALPRFRRFSFFGAYTEGWGLYAESLGKELGVYTDPYQYFGKLSAEIWRALRLIVDTGMHAKGWSREKALQYMLDNSSISETDGAIEIDRYIAMPAQALSYKIGQLKITELRNRAAQKLGAQFDVRLFHDEILKNGSLPLDVLDSHIDEWIDGQM